MASNKQQGKQQKLTAKQRAERVRAAQEREARAKEQREKAERTKKIFTIVVCVILVLAAGLPTMALAVLAPRRRVAAFLLQVCRVPGRTTTSGRPPHLLRVRGGPIRLRNAAVRRWAAELPLARFPYRVNVCACTTGSFAEQFMLI